MKKDVIHFIPDRLEGAFVGRQSTESSYQDSPPSAQRNPAK